MIIRVEEDQITPHVAVSVHLPCDIVPNIQSGGEWHYSHYRKGCTHPVILFVISMGEVDDNIPNIEVCVLPPTIVYVLPRPRVKEDNINHNIVNILCVHPPVLLFVLSTGWEDITPNITEVVHPFCDIVPTIQGQKGYYSQEHRWCTPPLMILFLISNAGKDDITFNIAGCVHPHNDIVHNIHGGRLYYFQYCRGGTLSLWYCT